MAVRPIDANELYRIEKLLDTDIVRQDKVALNLLEQVLYDIQHVPTLTQPPITGDTSDGYHTFNELYRHRAILFSVICNERPEVSWKSKRHHDGTMYDGMFIVGIDTPEGQATYHYDINPYWNLFRVKELELAPEWDGHTPGEAIRRIGTLTQPNEPLTLEQLREMDGKKVLFKPSWFESAEVFTVRLTNNLWHGCIVNGEGLYIELEAAAERGVYAYTPVHINRDVWKPCEHCKPSCYNCKKFEYSNEYELYKSCEECKSYLNFDPSNNYCSVCGRPLTEEAWQELEKRVRGEK